jgi:hypothetical protein
MFLERDWRPRRIPSRREFPTREIQSEFKKDVFTFVRVQEYWSNSFVLGAMALPYWHIQI